MFNRSSHIRDFHESDQSDQSDSDQSDQSDSLSVLGQVSLVSQKHNAHDTKRSRNRDDDTMLFRFTRSRPGDQEKSTVFFQNPETGETRRNQVPSHRFSKQKSSFFKKTKKKHVQIIVLHLMLSEISDKKAVFGCCSRFGKIDMMKRQKSPLGSGMER